MDMEMPLLDSPGVTPFLACSRRSTWCLARTSCLWIEHCSSAGVGEGSGWNAKDGVGQPKFGCPTFFLCGLGKIFSFFGLREVDMGVRRQNIRTKGVIGKILGNKELGEVRREVAAFPVDSLDARRTVPVWAFCFLSKGCSSQFWGIFFGGRLWKRVRGQLAGTPR